MGIMETLFGSPGKTDPSTVAPFQQPFLQNLFQRAEEASLGPSVSDPTLQGREMQLAAARGLSPFIQGAQGAGQFLTDPGLLSPESNPYLAQTAQAAGRPIMQALTEQILPNIRGGAIGAGQFGGSRQGIAEGIASRGALQQLGDISSNIFSQAYGQGLGALGQGLSLAPQTAGLGFLPGQAFQEIGAQQQLDPFRNLQNLQSLLGPPIVTGGGGTTGQPGIVSLNVGL